MENTGGERIQRAAQGDSRGREQNGGRGRKGRGERGMREGTGGGKGGMEGDQKSRSQGH